MDSVGTLECCTCRLTHCCHSLQQSQPTFGPDWSLHQSRHGNDLEQIVEELNRAASGARGMKPDSPISFSHADMASLDAILTQAVRLGASDVLLIADVSVTLRVGGRLAHSTGSPLTGEDTRNLLLPLMSSTQSQELNHNKFVDLCFSRLGDFATGDYGELAGFIVS